MSDIRQSKSKDFSFGNPTVIPLMQTWRATTVYLHGEPTQTLATAIGLHDAEHQYESFGYPIEVLMPYVANLNGVANWQSLLSSWYGVNTARSGQDITGDDLLVILDVTVTSDKQIIADAVSLMATAKKRNATILVITKPGTKLPKELTAFVGSFTGSINSYWKIFTYHTIANVVYNKKPRNIHLFGEGLRLVSSAIGAVDVLARFDEDNQSLALIANRVKIDERSPVQVLGQNITGEEIFQSFGIAITDIVPTGEGLEYSDKQILITYI